MPQRLNPQPIGCPTLSRSLRKVGSDEACINRFSRDARRKRNLPPTFVDPHQSGSSSQDRTQLRQSVITRTGGKETKGKGWAIRLGPRIADKEQAQSPGTSIKRMACSLPGFKGNCYFAACCASDEVGAFSRRSVHFCLANEICVMTVAPFSPAMYERWSYGVSFFETRAWVETTSLLPR